MKKTLLFSGLIFVQVLFAQGTWLTSGRTHPELSWFTLETEHFNIHYHNGIEDLARQGASIAEQVLPTLMEQLRVKSLPKIDITFTSEDEVMNGYALYSNMVFIWVDQNDVAIWLEDEKWLYQVTSHELQHVVLMNAIKSWMIQPFDFLFSGTPGWFVEGAAEYYTEKWRPYRADLSHKTHILTNKTDGMDPHHDGFSKMLYLADRFGDSTFIKIVSYRNKLKLFNFNKGFKKATGLTVAQFNEDWRRQMNTYYYGYRSQKELIREIGEVVSLPMKSVTALALAPDSSKIAVIGRRDDEQLDNSLFVLTLDSSAMKKAQKTPWFKEYFHSKTVTEDSAKKDRKKPRVIWEIEERDFGLLHNQLAWSADGKSVAYAKYHYGQHQALIWDIRVLDVVDGKSRWLTHSLRATQPDWSPDGRNIVFVAHAGNTSNLYTIHPEGGEPTPLTRFSHDTQLLNPRWSPDGQSIAYAKSGPDGNLDLYILEVNSGESRRISADPAVDYLPVWHPDGKKITYTSHAGSTPNLFTVDLDTDSLIQNTDVGDAVWTNQWTPRDSTILATTLTDVDSIRLVKIDPDRRAVTPPLSMRKPFVGWRTRYPDLPLPAVNSLDPVTVVSESPYRFTRHIKHLTSFVLPLDYLEGLTVWCDAMGRHIFQGLIATDWGFKYPSVAVSYLNAASGPLWGIDYMNRIDFQYQTYDAHSLWESRDGIRLWASQPLNLGNHLISSHSFDAELRLQKRTAYWETILTSYPIPESGQEGLLTLAYTWAHRRPHKSMAELPKNGWGVHLSQSLANADIWGDFSYGRTRADVFTNLPVGAGAMFLRGRWSAVTGANPPGQEQVGLTNDWTLYFPGAAGAVFGPESMNPRGWDAVRFGDRAYLTTAELRFPLISSFPVVNVLGVSIGRITGALITDYANAWNAGQPSGKPVFTAGYEGRISVTIGKVPLIVLSYGSAQTVKEWQNGNHPQNYLQFALINPF